MSGQAPTFRLNFEEAFRFVWRDPRWLSKLALGALFSLLSIFVVGGILTQGYLLIMAERIVRQEQHPLPEWDDWGEIFRQGFGAFLVSLVFALPLIIVVGLIALLYIPLIAASASGGQAAGEVAAGVGILIAFLGLLAIPLAFFVGIVVPAAHAQMVLHDGDLAAAFRLREVFGFIGRQKGQYALMLLLAYAASAFLNQIGYFACFIGIFVTTFVVQLFQYHLIGQLCWFDRTVLNAPQRREGEGGIG